VVGAAARDLGHGALDVRREGPDQVREDVDDHAFAHPGRLAADVGDRVDRAAGFGEADRDVAGRVALAERLARIGLDRDGPPGGVA
jgi:hypothetical protein